MKARLIAFAAEASLDTNQEVREKEEVRKRSYSMSQHVECGNDKKATERPFNPGLIYSLQAATSTLEFVYHSPQSIILFSDVYRLFYF
jgi:hypothetical protein